MDINLKSIKLENVKTVALCFSPEETLSRADISSKTGLSLVTVGKIADILIGKGALVEEKKINQSAGRRTGLLRLNPDRLVLNAELNNNKAVLNLFDVNLGKLETFTREAAIEEEFDTLINDLFAEAAMTILDKYGLENCSGVVLMVDDIEKRAHYSEIAQSFFPDSAVYADSVVNFSALYASHGMKDDEVLLYAYLSKNEVRGAFVLNHKLILRSDGRTSDFGTVIFPGNVRFIDVLRNAQTEEEHIHLISECICNTAKVILPDRVVIEVADDLYYDNMYEKIVKETVALLGYVPHCPLTLLRSETENRTCYHGSMLKIASKWLEKIILGE